MQLVNIWGPARTARQEADAAEVRVLRAALEWALANPPLLPATPPSDACLADGCARCGDAALGRRRTRGRP